MSVEALNIRPGQIVTVGGKLYGRCIFCDSIVRMDRWLLGGWHFCLDPDERDEIDRKRRRR